MTAKADTNPLREALKLARMRIEYLGAFGSERHQKANEADFFPIIDAALASEPVAGTGQRSSDDESGCPRKCGEATDSGGSGKDRNSEDTMQGDRPAAVVRVPSSERPPAPAGREACNCGVMCQDLGKDAGCRYLRPERATLRKLVDLTWNHVTESQAVPSTNLADELIGRAFAGSAVPPHDSVAQRIEQPEPDEGREDAGSNPAAVAATPPAPGAADRAADDHRFEFMEEWARGSHTGISFDWIPSVYGDKPGFRFMRHHYISTPHASIREAIDAQIPKDGSAVPRADGGAK